MEDQKQQVTERDVLKKAAVTLITDRKSIVFIKRKERAGDPWSGHVAFPGGYVKDGESDLDASRRECHEEIGFVPSRSQFYGVFRPHIREMLVSVFVDVEDISDNFVAGDEVERVFVLHRDELKPGYTNANFPCYNAGGYEIWGLTYRILKDYFSKQS